MTPIGFTGTSTRITWKQFHKIKDLFLEEMVRGPFELHHGDCVGADMVAHQIAVGLGCRIVLYPGVYHNGRPNDKAAGNTGNVVHPPMTMFARNRRIVDSTQRLIGVVKDSAESAGGTWYTIKYARSKKKPITIIWPDGSTTEEFQ